DRRVRAARAFAETALSRWPYPELLYRSSTLARRVRESAAAEGPLWIVAHSYHIGPTALDAERPAWVDFHNVESELWQGMSTAAARAGSRLFARWQAPRVRALEAMLLENTAGASCVSGRDAAAFAALSGGAAPVVVPNGVDLDRYSFRAAPAATERLFFVGDLSWAPNAEGIRWFARRVWPRLSRLRPRANVEVLGRRAPADLAGLADSRFSLPGAGGDTRPHWREA